MAFGLTLDGFNPKPLTILKTELDSAYKNAYGESVGSEPDGSIPAQSSMGQEIGILSERLALLWELGEATYAARDPDKAKGAALDTVCAITGTIRNGERKSSAILTATGDPATILNVGRVISVEGAKTRFATASPPASVTIAALTTWTASTAYTAGQRVTNASRVYLCIGSGVSAASGGPSTTAASILDNTVTWRFLGEGTGAVDVQVLSETAGAFAAVSGSLTVIETPVSGWRSAINILDATVGAAVELDPDLRIRREDELQAGANATLDAIRANLLQVGKDTVNPVIACTVFQNTTLITDIDGLPPKSIECLVLGGVPQDIFDAVLETVDAGIETFGNQVGTSVDSAGNPHTVKFSRPTELNIFIELDVVKVADQFPLDGEAQIKLAIVSRLSKYSFGKDVTKWGIGAPLDEGIDGILNVTAIRLGTAPSPTGTIDIPVGIREIARFDTSRITVFLTNGVP